MKFIALTALIASVTAVSDWQVCTGGSDCSTAGSKCCNASSTGKPTVKICGPSSTKIVPNGEPTYGGYTFDCLAAASSSEAPTAAERLMAGTAFVVGALYFLAWDMQQKDMIIDILSFNT